MNPETNTTTEQQESLSRNAALMDAVFAAVGMVIAMGPRLEVEYAYSTDEQTRTISFKLDLSGDAENPLQIGIQQQDNLEEAVSAQPNRSIKVDFSLSRLQKSA